MTTFDYLRKRLHEQAGIGLEFRSTYHKYSYHSLWLKTCNDDFSKLMDARLCMGQLRYGHEKSAKIKSFMDRLYDKLKLYHKTGNTELLVDAANYCRLEFKSKCRSKFQPIDRHD